VVDQWSGRPILGSLPRLFLDLFYRTSLVIEGTDAFLMEIFSPSDAERAYIHFIGDLAAVVAGAGRLRYEEFFHLAGPTAEDGVSDHRAGQSPLGRVPPRAGL
jgi:hypothetical protein